MMLDVIDLSNDKSKVKEIELDDSIFAADVRIDLISRVVKWQLAKSREGSHKTKTRSEVKHTTRKPFKQKGTGRARQGMKSVSQMRGGGVALGPVVRDFSHKLTKKVRALGLKSAISDKVNSGNFFIVENLEFSDYKTSIIGNMLEKIGFHSVLFVDSEESNNNFKRASANLIGINVLPQIGLNVFDILKHDNLVFTERAINELERRLNGVK